MKISRARATALVPAVLVVATLGACGDDGSDEAGEVETVFVTGTPSAPAPSTPAEPTSTFVEEAETTMPSDGCDVPPPAGTVEPDAEDVAWDTGTVGLTVELSDGTTDCLIVNSDPDDLAGSFSTIARELSVEVGADDAGLNLTVTDYTDDGVDDIANGDGDPFTGIQYDGVYYADSFHTGCTVEILDLTRAGTSGTFECANLAVFEGGPWSGAPSDLTLVSASGWWVLGG